MLVVLAASVPLAVPAVPEIVRVTVVPAAPVPAFDELVSGVFVVVVVLVTLWDIEVSSSLAVPVASGSALAAGCMCVPCLRARMMSAAFAVSVVFVISVVFAASGM